MTKKTNEQEAPEETPVFDANRPQLPEASTLPDMETLSHNWQPNSPAVDMRDSSGKIAGAVNILAQAEAAQEEKDTEEKAESLKIPADEYKERTKLPVDDPRYINASLDHHEEVK